MALAVGEGSFIAKVPGRTVCTSATMLWRHQISNLHQTCLLYTNHLNIFIGMQQLVGARRSLWLCERRSATTRGPLRSISLKSLEGASLSYGQIIVRA